MWRSANLSSLLLTMWCMHVYMCACAFICVKWNLRAWIDVVESPMAGPLVWKRHVCAQKWKDAMRRVQLCDEVVSRSEDRVKRDDDEEATPIQHQQPPLPSPAPASAGRTTILPHALAYALYESPFIRQFTLYDLDPSLAHPPPPPFSLSRQNTIALSIRPRSQPVKIRLR